MFTKIKTGNFRKLVDTSTSLWYNAIVLVDNSTNFDLIRDMSIKSLKIFILREESNEKS